MLDNIQKGKLLIFSAPSGSGKTTLVKYIMGQIDTLLFSISATSRKIRSNEVDGLDYYFLSVEDFKKKIANNEFVEWEEVYKGRYYGSLKSEVERIRNQGLHVVFDVDVVGGVNIKKLYGDVALSIFVMPPSLAALKQRLLVRGTDNSDDIQTRLEKAEHELTYSNKFDMIIINDNLEHAKKESLELVKNFIKLN
ncbi:MAG: guanylate kinase [Bacteroidetes bacterium]|nr:guanylate kinase [Bacteroidota bacterium]